MTKNLHPNDATLPVDIPNIRNKPMRLPADSFFFSSLKPFVASVSSKLLLNPLLNANVNIKRRNTFGDSYSVDVPENLPDNIMGIKILLTHGSSKVNEEGMGKGHSDGSMRPTRSPKSNTMNPRGMKRGWLV